MLRSRLGSFTRLSSLRSSRYLVGTFWSRAGGVGYRSYSGGLTEEHQSSQSSKESTSDDDSIQFTLSDLARLCEMPSRSMQVYIPPVRAIKPYKPPVRSLTLIERIEKNDRREDRRDERRRKHREYDQQDNERLAFAANLVGIFAVSLMFAAVLYIIYKAHLEPREREIIGNRILGLDDDFERMPGKENGTLNNEILATNAQLFLKKGAHDRQALLRELVVATALNIINPTSQPQSGIFHEPIPGTDKARYYTMSEIKPGSMDLEDFILRGDWKEKLAKKPMIGLDTALALTGVIAGQQDCKFANIIITEYDDRYEVGLIDFELCGTSYVGKIFNRYQYTTDSSILVSYIRELHDKDNEFNVVKLRLSDDPRAREFVAYALENSMGEENIVELYRRVAGTDFISPVISRLESLYDAESGIVTRRDIRMWTQEMQQWQASAAKFVEEYEQKQIVTYRV